MSGNKLIMILVLFISLHGKAQTDALMLQQSLKKDTAINAVALYPLELRTSILVVSANTEGLLKMESMQNSSKERFRKILSQYSQEEQKKLWDIARYPDLVEKLAQKPRRKKLDEILAAYPESIRETAKAYSSGHHDALVLINELNKGVQSDFETIIRNYPQETQLAFRNLLSHPEAIELLAANMHMTVLWGDIYKRDPRLVKSKLDSLSTELAAQNAKSLKDWQDGLEKDPEAKKEFEKAAKEYAAEEGYSDDQLVIHDTKVINVYVHPYPYWYGTPWWWDYPRWYPYPYWYDWGYYYGPYGIVYIGYPSWYFTHWYFYHPHHHYDHTHFSDYCIDHYYGHRGSYSGVHRGVSEWVNDNEDRLPGDFLSNQEQRPQRLKEIGRFEMDYRQYEKNAPVMKTSKDQYFRENADKYPNLKPALSDRVKPGPEPVSPTPGRTEPVSPKPKPEVITPKPEEPRIKQPQPQPRIKTPSPQPRVKTPPPAPKRQPAPQPKPRPPKQPKEN